jgi:hypothetical protein
MVACWPTYFFNAAAEAEAVARQLFFHHSGIAGA